jgi:hypothetical protein
MANRSRASRTSLRYAENFPEGYGDFAFQSSDGVIFHFPQFLLSFASPVFKDMYDMGNNAENGEILKLTEDAATLDLLLQFIDPTKESPRLIWDTVEKFIDAADKYQVNGVPSWFQKEAELAALNNHYIERPMLCLELADRFEFKNLARLATRDLIKLSENDLRFQPKVNGHLVSRIYQLRADRANRLARAIKEIDIYTGEKLKNESCHLHSEARSRFDVVGAIRAIISFPHWENLKFVFDLQSEHDRYACVCEYPRIPPSVDDKMWALESEIPVL